MSSMAEKGGRTSDVFALSGREALAVALLAAAAAVVLALGGESRPRAVTAPLRPSPLKVDVNSAPLDLLEALPGMGPRAARRVVRYRSRVGPISSAAELSLASGLPPARVEELLPMLTFGPPPPAGGHR